MSGFREAAEHTSFDAPVHGGGETSTRPEFEPRLRAEIERRMAATPAMLHSINEAGLLISVSDAWLAKLGYTRDEVLGRPSTDFLSAESRERAINDIVPELFRVGRVENVQYTMVKKGGGVIDVLISGVLAEDSLGLGRVSLSVVTDVTALVDSKRRVLESEARYRLLADNSSDMVFQLDRDLVRRYVSPACREILGYEPDEMLGIKPASMAHPEDAPRVALAFNSLLGGGVEQLSLINRIRHKDGRWIWVEARLRALRGAKTDEPIGVIGALRDISVQKAGEDELAEANSRLQTLAGQDALTGLANRRTFDEALEKEFLRARRDDFYLALVMIDVDYFKAFNDCYGHQVGDECLRAVARAIKAVAKRPGDVVARYGGEEFVMMLPSTDVAGALLVAENARQAVEALSIAHAKTTTGVGVVSVSLGIASVRPNRCATAGAEELIAEADAMLYEAKRSGRNSVMALSRIKQDLARRAEALMPHENERLAALAAYEMAGATKRTLELDRIARMAATLMGVPIGLVSIVGADEQTFAGNFGLDGVDFTGKDVSFCAHTILGEEPMVIHDATKDPRFEDNALVTGSLGIRYYAGAPIVSKSTGHHLGAVCVIDKSTRKSTSATQRALISDLADMAATVIEDKAKSAQAITSLPRASNGYQPEDFF